MPTETKPTKPYIKYEWIINNGPYFVVYTPYGERYVFDTRSEAEGFIDRWVDGR